MRSEATIRNLVAKFESCTLLGYEWTHEAHLIVAAVYALESHNPLEEIRTRIQALNSYFGIDQTPSRGYHETLTVAWMRILGHSIRQLPAGASFAERINHAVDANLDKSVISTYYSRELLMSPAARHGFVEPDGQPLPA